MAFDGSGSLFEGVHGCRIQDRRWQRNHLVSCYGLLDQRNASQRWVDLAQPSDGVLWVAVPVGWGSVASREELRRQLGGYKSNQERGDGRTKNQELEVENSRGDYICDRYVVLHRRQVNSIGEFPYHYSRILGPRCGLGVTFVYASQMQSHFCPSTRAPTSRVNMDARPHGLSPRRIPAPLPLPSPSPPPGRYVTLGLLASVCAMSLLASILRI